MNSNLVQHEKELKNHDSKQLFSPLTLEESMYFNGGGFKSWFRRKIGLPIWRFFNRYTRYPAYEPGRDYSKPGGSRDITIARW